MKGGKKTPLAVISGSTGHIGSAIAESLGNSGWRVVGLTRNRTRSPDVHACDITDEVAVGSVIEKVVRKYGPIDACIHAAAAPIENKTLLNIQSGSFDASIAAAARGAFLLANAAIPHMRSGAAFIGITSKLIEPSAALMPMGAYIPAKYALHGFLRALAADTRERGIRVYAVSPGFIHGGLNRNVPKTVLELLAKKTGVGQTTAEEVANIIKLICIEPKAYPLASSISIPGKAMPL